ncbi:MAG: UDP-glucose 4-epimerase GalE [Candidatus Obscuribacterales bacterium]|nr:UDP-glucose 4-epimerase GalE [Candidatus Obscuribacterales bacterium]
MSTILVTGAAGYIGCHFVRRLLSRRPDVEIIAVDNLSLGHRESLPPDDRLRFFGKDVGDFDFMSTLLKNNNVDAVVHFAAFAYVGESQENPFKYFDNNVVATLNLFKAMQEASVDKLVFSSSCATYGNPDYCPIDENHPQRPVSVYGMTKFIIEKAIQALADAKDWSFVSLRYFNAAGCDESSDIGESHDPETHLIPLTLQTAIGQRDQLNVWGNDYDTADGTCVRDYVHVNDLADAHILALDKLKEKAKLSLNLGSSVGASVKEVIRVCEEVTGRKINVNYCARRPGDAVALYANNDKATEMLGWKPEYSLEKIVETAWLWEQNRKF